MINIGTMSGKRLKRSKTQFKVGHTGLLEQQDRLIQLIGAEFTRNYCTWYTIVKLPDLTQERKPYSLKGFAKYILLL